MDRGIRNRPRNGEHGRAGRDVPPRTQNFQWKVVEQKIDDVPGPRRRRSGVYHGVASRDEAIQVVQNVLVVRPGLGRREIAGGGTVVPSELIQLLSGERTDTASLRLRRELL